MLPSHASLASSSSAAKLHYHDLPPQVPLRTAIVTVPATVARKHLKLLCLLAITLVFTIAAGGGRLAGGGPSLFIGPQKSLRIPLDLVDEAANRTAVEPPLTSLGYEADLVYEAMGSIDKDEYRIELETFLHRSFPAREMNATDTESLISILHEYLPAPPEGPRIPHPQTAFRRLLLLPTQLVLGGVRDLFWPVVPLLKPPRPARNIPKSIYQTSWYPGSSPPPDKLPPQTWRNLNQDYSYSYYDNDAAEAFMIGQFNQTDLNPKEQRPGFSLLDTYFRMRDVPVMQSDLWRYAVLASQGGVYSKLRPRTMRSS